MAGCPTHPSSRPRHLDLATSPGSSDVRSSQAQQPPLTLPLAAITEPETSDTQSPSDVTPRSGSSALRQQHSTATSGGGRKSLGKARRIQVCEGGPVLYCDVLLRYNHGCCTARIWMGE